MNYPSNQLEVVRHGSSHNHGSPDTERRARRNAIDLGTPPFYITHAKPRRNAIDYGVPQVMARPPVRLLFITFSILVETRIQRSTAAPAVRGALPPLFDLSQDAPSRWDLHPYSVLQLAQLGSGNARSAPPPDQCAECRMDVFIENERRNYPASRPLVLDQTFRGPKPGAAVLVPFAYEGTRSPGVFVNDILEFKANMMQANYRLVRQAIGPIKVTLEIQGVGEIQDVLYANCAHRVITRANLAWVLAFSFFRLATKTFGVSVDDLALLLLHCGSDGRWVAKARHIHRIDC
ncbi:hypothetical protein K438DRAFT_1970055 [Mycena galopus ATCC 62051]|nr:hypothetical protein K438DRAFT_1970055 [Mycena galopus ATCC 62051]